MWLLASVNCLCLKRASLRYFVAFAVVVYGVSSLFFFFSSFYWLESSVRGFRVFREVFVLFGIQCLALFWALVGITVRVEIRCSKRWGFDVCSFCKKHAFFVFSTWDSISQPQGRERFRYPLYYWNGIVEGCRNFFLLYINVATCER